MELETDPWGAWRAVENEIGRLRAGFEGGDDDPGLAEKLGVKVGALTQPERPILANAISEVQVRSKLWLLDELGPLVRSEGLAINVLGGWCGVLPWLAKVTGQLPSAEWTSIDFDPEACSLGQRAFGESVPGMRFLCQDIYDLDYRELAGHKASVIINTICEHISDVPKWRSLLPKGTLTVLQSNNYRCCPDHINCVDSAEELANDANLERVLFCGTLPMTLFTRYMVIGVA
jgi:hypothetical protein